ncbi:MAG: ATP-binding cassette domain-containing protein [Actinobacteria bacterium]|nr:ATP-binding cassette domain-containing protein [Actinomycetota bacterium]
MTTTEAREAVAAHSEASSSEPTELLRVEDLVTWFSRGRGIPPVRAVDGVSLSLHKGEALGLVGESGCGKTTLARTAVRLIEPTAGRIWFKGQDITEHGRRQLAPVRRSLQMVFQDPYASLNPRMTAGEIVAQPLRIHHRYRHAGGRAKVAELFELVGLDPDHLGRFPHEFSGGQRQRIGIARALVLDPEVIVFDEPVSSLDVSIRAQIINLLADLRDELGLAYLFIAHDLSVVRHIADRVAVMYLGVIVETGERRAIYQQPMHPYTQALLAAVPIPDPSRRDRARPLAAGELPTAARPPSGCRFRTRCWKADDRCACEPPELMDRFDHGHPSACHYAAPREAVER